MRIALSLEYNGTPYHGWQRQEYDNLPTVQAFVEAALTKVADSPIEIFCAGRTDAGVHALEQIIHFDTTALRPLSAWMLGTNAFLPADIRVHGAAEMAEEFHARFSATARSYRYVILNALVKPAILREQVTWYPRTLNVHAMNEAALCLIGEFDFSSFRGASCQAKSPVREIFQLQVSRRGSYVFIDVTANAFLHHMVRNITGALLAIGSEQKPVGWMADILAGRDRRLAGVTAPAAGLYLTKVRYPERYQLPKSGAMDYLWRGE